MPDPSVAPTLPPWWLDEALAAETDAPDAPALEGEIRVDVAVIGGGYTGLWTALALREREPSLNVAVLEAEIVGWGPSGRNGGFLNGYWTHLSRLRPVFGDEAALEIGRTAGRIVPAVKAFTESRGDDVWLREGGYLKVSAAPAQDAAVDKAIRTAEELGVPEEAQPLNAEQVAEHIRSERFRRGVLFRDGATVQPARLARSLRRAALADGIAVHERTRVTAIRAGHADRPRDASRPRPRRRGRRRDERGDDRLETAPAPPDELRLLRRPHRAHAGAPRRARLDGRRGDHRRPDVHPLLPHDGRRARADGQRLRADRPRRAARRRKVHRRRPDCRPRRARSAAAAPRARRCEGRAFLGRPDRRLGRPLPVLRDAPETHAVHYGVGYSGHGVGPAWLGGQILASLALRRDDEWSASPLVRTPTASLPPEPLKRLGGGAIRGAILAAEEAEEEGRRAPAVARAVGALPRLLRMPLGTR